MINWSEEALLLNDDFRQWVLSNDETTHRKWIHLLEQATDEQRESARRVIEFLQHLPEEETLSEEETRSIWNKVINQQVVEKSGNTRQLYLRRWMGVAASILMISLAGWWSWWSNLDRLIEISTEFGQQKSVLLPDSSVVILNGNSKLSYDASWSETQRRDIWLEGEGYFKVTRQVKNRQPIKFTVHSGDLNIEVLGTQFNVKNRRDWVHVVLDEGKIQVSRPNDTEGQEKLAMKPGDFLEFSKQKNTFSRQQVTAPKVLSSWTRKVLVFNNTPLKEIAQTLEDTYGLTVSFAEDTLKSMTFTGNLPSEDPDAILETLSKAFELKISRTHRQGVLIKSP